MSHLLPMSPVSFAHPLTHGFYFTATLFTATARPSYHPPPSPLLTARPSRAINKDSKKERKFSTENTTVNKTQRAIPVSPRKARRRTLSLITFAAADQPESTSGDEVEQHEDLEDDAYFGDGDDDADVNQTLAEAHRYKYNARPSTLSASETLSRLLRPQTTVPNLPRKRLRTP
ncbi:hypothetical protein NUW54_g251 [Trametes sanguinea]|uniref:Uncharacterized protein n=1 Tax=Trametes sanguinea TaxID=158606 RepID=A0ACC1QB56_9APHY|nr:hypothetical protein NUW54_g251 [Trametes sanguinea]